MAYMAFKIIEYSKYLLVGGSLFFLALSGVLFMKRDKLFCFSDSRVENIHSAARNNVVTNNIDKISVISENELMYNRNLFPQLANKNIKIWKGEEFLQ